MAADDIVSLCTDFVAVEGTATDDSLRAEAANAEQRIAESADRVEAADGLIARLGSQTRGATVSDRYALAQYCAAAGEAFRLGKGGSANQARTLLLGAYRNAQNAGDVRTGALAAYRIGLLTVGSGGAAGLRSALKRSEEKTENTAAPSTETGACRELEMPGLDEASNIAVTILALNCALEKAIAGNNYAVGAKAGLRLGRFWLDYARRFPDDRDYALDEARQASLSAIPMAEQVDDLALRANLLSRLADTIIDTGGNADSALARVVALLDSDADDNASQKALAEGLRGRLALNAGRKQEAAGRLRNAIFFESQAETPLRLTDWQLLLAQADPARKDAHVLAAFRALGAVRPLIPRFDPVTEESNFAVRIRPVFESVVDVMLSGDGGDSTGTQIDMVQTVVEQYRQAELQSIFGSDCVPAREPVDPKSLRANETILYPVLLGDRVELLYASGKGKSGYKRLKANRSVNRAEVARLAAAMIGSTSLPEDESWKAPAARLYEILIAPIESELEEGGTLVIVPDGPLSGLPFAALLDGSGKSLIQRAKISVVPSLAYTQPGEMRATRDLRVVAAALEKEVELSGSIFPMLTGTGDEARAVVAGSRASRLLENFKRTDLVNALDTTRIDVLHLATHASFNGRSDRSFIVADGEAIPIAELRTLIGQNATRGDTLDLLVLSACETAVGDDEASLGLAGAAVQSGASSAIASLWEVNDLGTSELMKAFYARYRKGESKADALRNAQLSLIGQGGQLAEPNIWAAFTLLGSWR